MFFDGETVTVFLPVIYCDETCGKSGMNACESTQVMMYVDLCSER